MKYNITIFLTLFVLITLISSCNSTKYVPENKLLLVKNSIESSSYKKDKLNPYIIQKPNNKVAKLPVSLWFYGWGDKNYERKWDDKILRYKDSSHFFTKVFSLKQSIGWANFNKELNKWIFKNGQAPVLLNQKKTNKTLRNLKLYYLDEGYFKAKIDYKYDTISPKKVEVTYQINTDKPYFIDTLRYNIASPIVDSLYKLHQEASFIKEKQQFKTSNFEKEAERLTAIFRNAGIYHFSKYAINFREIDTTAANYKTDVLVDISNQLVEENDSLVTYPYYISTIKQVKIVTDYSYLQRDDFLKDSIRYNDFDFYAYDKVRYKPNLLSQSIFIKPGQKYSDINNELTRQHLRELGGFTSIRINYEEIEDHQLIAHVLLTPNKQYGVKLETEVTHSNIKPFGISGKLSFKNNNVLQRNEIFMLGLQGSFLNSADIQESILFDAWELGVDVSYKIPRFLMPFYKQNTFLKRMSPKTKFTLGTSLQKNIGLDKQRFTAIVDYDWKPSPKVRHKLELFNAQFIKNLNVNSYFDVYTSEFRKLKTIQGNNPQYLPQEPITNSLNFINTALEDSEFQLNSRNDYLNVKNIKKRYDIITEDVLVPAITYQLIYNTQLNYKDKDFSYYRAQIASSGLLSSSLAKSPTSDSKKQILGTNVAQFIKLDIELIKHWVLDQKNVMAFRTNLGIALPYGNSTSLPFSRSYFAGGPNDIRAWRIYELGPGAENSGLEFNVGNMKLLSSIEYRFDIISSLKGALFVDAGNIWDTTNSSLTSEVAKFKGFESLQNIAIGSGLGIRYDFSFLVFRADLGFKTYEPYNSQDNRWFRNYNLSNSVLNIGINYPF